ncbi:competence type IV pilus ATPase ComGA [Alkalihalobacillus hemicellulosilyticus]|uniref:Type IV fimbrial assembly, ATPase PilB n=1 Tax=Halalkalibacter hemicellulosilyticusJCM 9152 TaxID=1236971 RepID=W4QKQ0_9BACI|nr:competence type IV pilus ATPase ComGA [Halalkalibacter hemicellulosilyticus]GAE32671.1 type IV fimbrial assembly, ATPase PilB [Halalkalibacter hemicellulosilyticusJCM 9152]
MEDIEPFCMSLINQAIGKQASDIHFLMNDSHCSIFYRSSGQLKKWRELPLRIGERLVSHLKYRSGMDIGEQRKPQSMAITHKRKYSTYSLRLSTLPNKQSEGLIIRILPHRMTHSIATLSLFPQASSQLHQLRTFQSGLCLFAGSTGSGKTTTLYAILEHIRHSGNKSIITIEDPIEIPLNDIVQVEVNEKAGLTFDSILRAALRHDPDVILVGEIRDEETAALAVRASLTGHLVLATVHANDVQTTFLRLLNLGVKSRDLIDCSKMVMVQQLVKLRCPLCCHEAEEDERCSCQRPLRKALVEVVVGEELKLLAKGQLTRRSSFKDQARKAWVLGYISEMEFRSFLT